MSSFLPDLTGLVEMPATGTWSSTQPFDVFKIHPQCPFVFWREKAVSGTSALWNSCLFLGRGVRTQRTWVTPTYHQAQTLHLSGYDQMSSIPQAWIHLTLLLQSTSHSLPTPSTRPFLALKKKNITDTAVITHLAFHHSFAYPFQIFSSFLFLLFNLTILLFGQPTTDFSVRLKRNITRQTLSWYKSYRIICIHNLFLCLLLAWAFSSPILML